MPARAAITGGKFLADGWSLSGATLTTRFTWVVGGNFATVGGTMPGADLSAAGSLSPSAIVARTTAATMGAGAQVAGGAFTLSGTPAAAALSAAAAAVAGGVFTPVARNIGGGAFSASASINGGISGDGPKGGGFTAAAGVVGGFFTGVQKGAAISAAASLVKGYLPARFSDVVLQIPGDGTNNSTNIVDVSNNALTITRSGSPVISTAASKYGGASVRFHESSSDRLTVSSASLSVGSNDFWLETWLAFVDTDWDYMISLNHTANVDFNLGSFFRFGWLNGNPRAFMRLYVGGDASSSSSRYGVLIASGTTTQTPSEMNHFCAGRVNGELAVWFNGVMYQDEAGTDSNGKTIGSATVQTTGSDTFIGPRCTASGFTLHPDAYMDDFRFVKATPPWGLANFTPPIAAHPTS